MSLYNIWRLQIAVALLAFLFAIAIAFVGLRGLVAGYASAFSAGVIFLGGLNLALHALRPPRVGVYRDE